MRPIALMSLAALLLAGCAHRAELTPLPLAEFQHPPSVLQATNPRMPDGTTAFAMAPVDSARNRALSNYQTPRQEYPSVGGNILRGMGD
jgi:hypothetical protein